MQRAWTTTAIAIAAFLASSSRSAFAREAPSVDDDNPELGDLEEEALGTTRGLLRTRAESVSFDAKERSLELSGNVRIDAPPFHLQSQHIKLSRTRYGIEADGQGRLAFCPCLGTPLTVEFDKAIVAPPGELLLKNPKLELFGVPVMYLPWFWLRSEEKIGVLPPEIAYRGQDGLYLGDGVHLPWKDRGTRQSMDIRGGAYFQGGFVADVRLRSPIATTKIRYDRLPSSTAPLLRVPGSSADERAEDGLVIDARGASNDNVSVEGNGDHHTTIAWDADVIRGRRGVVATTDLDEAAKPWDRGAASGALRLAGGSITAETGARAVTRRGGDLTAVEAAGPFMALRSSGGAPHITYDATMEGGAVRTSGVAASLSAALPPSFVPDTVSYARGEFGMLATSSLGAASTSFDLRGAGDVAAEGRRHGFDRALTSRIHLGVPLARGFDVSEDKDNDPHDRNDPIVHVIEPFISAAVLHTKSDAILESLPGRGIATLSGTAPLADAGIRSTLGRWGTREAIEMAASVGAIYGSAQTSSRVRNVARGRLSATATWTGATVETGHLTGEDSGKVRGGGAIVGRLRLGRTDGVRALANVATRIGIDPVVARAITEPVIEAPAGFLAAEGTTGGAGLIIPWSHTVTTSASADADATAGELVALRGGLELHDRCGCVTLRANGSHRIGRKGVDVWIALDFATNR